MCVPVTIHQTHPSPGRIAWQNPATEVSYLKIFIKLPEDLPERGNMNMQNYGYDSYLMK